MRIAICSTSNIGKSTLIQDFLQEWDMYGREVKTYRDVLNEKGLSHSKNTNKESQKAILDYMVETLKEFKEGDKVIFDRCPLDNLVYSMWGMSQEDNDIDEDFVDECIPIVNEALKNLDIIFFIPITKHNEIEVQDNGDRETDKQYIREIDSFFKVIKRHYHENPQENPFFPRDDSPALIEVFGSREERIQMIKLYLDIDGDLIGGDGQSDIFSPENMDLMEELLASQGLAKKEEDEVKAQMLKIKNELPGS